MFTYVTLCSFIYAVAEPALVGVPQNVAVLRGSDVTLECSSDNPSSFIAWFNRDCPSYSDSDQCAATNKIYNGFSDNDKLPRFSVVNGNNDTHVTRDLHIRVTELSDAGVYVCAELIPGETDNKQTSRAQLIIVDEDPICTTNRSASGPVQEYDIIVMTCSIAYNGIWMPVVHWFSSITGEILDGATRLEIGRHMITVTSQLTITAAAGANGSKIVHAVYFTLPNSATRVPRYEHRWESPALRVLLRFAPRNLMIIPRQSVYHPGDRIECSSEGNPTPSYHWTDLVSGTVVTQGPVLVITEDMANISTGLTFQCTATNQFNGATHTNAMNFTVAITPSKVSSVETSESNVSSAFKLAAVVLAVIAGISIVVNALMVWWYIIRRNPVNASNRDTNRDQPVADAATRAVGDEYQQLGTIPHNEPTYSQLARR